jgi:hypothetical protein
MLTKFLVLTLYSGEGEVEDCKSSVQRQKGVDARHVIFSNLGNVEAHEKLYQTIMEECENFDLFIKLDADMVLARDTVLDEIADYFRREKELDHLVLPVFDWPSRRQIQGVTVFGGRVRWTFPLNSLTPDTNPIRVGKKRVIPTTATELVHHMQAPTREQCYLYGFHKGLKIAQRGGHLDRPSLATTHYAALLRIRDIFLAERCVNRALILNGARDAIGSNVAIMERKSPLDYNACENASLPDDFILSRAQKCWHPRSVWLTYFYARFILPTILRSKARKYAGLAQERRPPMLSRPQREDQRAL